MAKYIGKLASWKIRCIYDMQVAQFHQQEVLRGYSVMAHTLAGRPVAPSMRG
jgi:hypothetical protein